MLLNIHIFIISLLEIIFNVLHLVGCKWESSCTAHSSFMYMYLLPDNSQINDQNVS